jgi:hypothetical protein
VQTAPGPLVCGGAMARESQTAADKFDDEHYPAYTMGRAAEMLGATPGFLRSLDLNGCDGGADVRRRGLKGPSAGQGGALAVFFPDSVRAVRHHCRPAS